VFEEEQFIHQLVRLDVMSHILSVSTVFVLHCESSVVRLLWDCLVAPLD
jgi:hypothetical protein